MSQVKKEITRCAIYTRKSTDENLDSDFNSLDAQREAAENYILSQKTEGWRLIPDLYDDGGFTGGNTDRPGLRKLMKDIESGHVDCVVVYKVDRLSRSLSDFAKLMDVFEQHDVSFVSVTQQFNTTSSMGRLTLNILLSFAQFEREIIAERIRDKIAASMKKGKNCGGRPILGYNTVNGELEINEAEAEQVREIFRLFLKTKSAAKVVREINSRGWTTKSGITKKNGKPWGGRKWTKTSVRGLLLNAKYAGFISYKGTPYPGQHVAIIDRKTWQRTQEILQVDPHRRKARSKSKTESLLKGIIRCGHCDHAMGHTYTRRRGKTYSYYVCRNAYKHGFEHCPVRMIPSGEIDGLVVDRVRAIFRTPEIVARVHREIGGIEGLSESDVVDAMQNIDPLWEMLFPAEQARIIANLVESVVMTTDGVKLEIHSNGLLAIAEEMSNSKRERA